MVDSNEEIAARLNWLRETALKISAAELCREIKVAPNRWSQYESGDRRITLDVATRLVKRYGVTLDWIYTNNPAGLPLRLAQQGRPAAE